MQERLNDANRAMLRLQQMDLQQQQAIEEEHRQMLFEVEALTRGLVGMQQERADILLRIQQLMVEHVPDPAPEAMQEDPANP